MFNHAKSSGFIALLATLIFASVARAGWSELGWCYTPLEVHDRADDMGGTKLIASGEFSGAKVKLYRTISSVAAFTDTATDELPQNVGVELGNAGTKDGRYAVEVGESEGEEGLVLVLDKNAEDVDLVGVASEFLKASYFVKPSGVGERAALLDSGAILALPSWTTKLERLKWVGKDSVSGRVNFVAYAFQYFPSNELSDANYLQQESEAKLKELGYTAVRGQTLSMFKKKVNSRVFSRGEEESVRWAAGTYLPHGEWLYLIFVESPLRDRVDEFLQTMKSHSMQVDPKSITKLSRGWRSVRRTKKVVAAVDENNQLRVVFQDENGEAVHWYGPIVPLQLVNKDDETLSGMRSTSSRQFSLIGERIEIAPQAYKLVVRLPGDRSVRVIILRPPD